MLNFFKAAVPAQKTGPDNLEANLTNREVEVLRIHVDELRAENERLRALLEDAAEDVAHWGGYADSYFQEKHDLQADIRKYREAANGDARPVATLGFDNEAGSKGLNSADLTPNA